MTFETEAIARRLRAHQPVLDAQFDGVFPDALRPWSRDHWTPVEVAQRAVAWLGCGAGDQVLDVGAGAGKFCVVGALSCEARFVGLERRPALIHAAVRAARVLRVDRRVRFEQASVMAIDWQPFAGIYLYNPFGELLFAVDARHATEPDEPRTTEQRRAAYDRAVVEVERRLDELAPNTRVVTFHGFGGQMPRGFELMGREIIARGPLELWVKRGPGRMP